ncbi:MAG TPA: DUF423 domain-containing protein [Steroidobacteraceae bacterium]|jgi:uncharacterized membrane protein YgdD (TMEM256/DUF423 family)|nr:DUF423 domain-containing protein [Steroidobacteraceae bacterium]
MSPAARTFAVTAALLLALATVVGAFNAHALSGRLAPDAERIVQTAVQYQFYHALGLLGVAVLMGRLPAGAARAMGWLQTAGWLLIAGVVLFSGSLYALAGGVGGSLRLLVGALTPLGGLSLILAWCAAAAGIARSATSSP